MEKIELLLDALDRANKLIKIADAVIEDQSETIDSLMRVLEMNEQSKTLEIKKLLEPSLN